MLSVHVCFRPLAVIVSILPKIEGGNPARRSRPFAEFNDGETDGLDKLGHESKY
jgi:hypothetical protein